MQATPSILERPMTFHDWTGMRWHLLHAYEDKVLPRALDEEITAEWHSCWLLKRGSVRLTTGSRTAVARPGQWVFVANPTRRQRFTPDAEILSVRFDLTWPGGEPVLPVRENLIFDASRFPRLEKAGRALVREVRQAFAGGGPDKFLPLHPCSVEQYLHIQNLMPQWLAVYLRTQAALGNVPSRFVIQDDRIRKAVAELDRYPLRSVLPWDRLLQCSGMGRSQFDSLFTRQIGLSPGRYWNRRRRQSARELLEHSRLSIKEIAFELGFRHASHFSLWFRQMEGVSASQFRAARGRPA